MNRKRKHRFLVSATEEEIKHINKCVETSGLSRDQYTRMLYSKVIPRPCPSKELIETLNQLRRIGNNINQIAHIANKTQNINKDYFEYCYKELLVQISEIKNLMLSSKPLEVNGGND